MIVVSGAERERTASQATVARASGACLTTKIGAILIRLGTLIAFSTGAAGAVAPSPVAPKADDLLIVAGRERYMLTASTAQFAAALDPASRAIVLAALRPDGRVDRDALWSLLAVGAVQFRREVAGGGDTLWFNPLFDAGIAIRWRHDANGWVVTAAAPILGETVRGDAEPQGRLAPTPAWLMRAPSIGAGLRLSEAATASQLASEGWSTAFAAPDTLRAARARTAISRVARGLLALRGMAADTRYRGALRTLRLSLTGGGGQAAPQPILAGLAAMGEAARSTLRPVAAFRRHDGWTVSLQSPNAPTVTLLAHFLEPAAQGGGPPLPATIARWDIALFGAPIPATRIGGFRP